MKKNMMTHIVESVSSVAIFAFLKYRTYILDMLSRRLQTQKDLKVLDSLNLKIQKMQMKLCIEWMAKNLLEEDWKFAVRRKEGNAQRI